MVQSPCSSLNNFQRQKGASNAYAIHIVDCSSSVRMNNNGAFQWLFHASSRTCVAIGKVNKKQTEETTDPAVLTVDTCVSLSHRQVKIARLSHRHQSLKTNSLALPFRAFIKMSLILLTISAKSEERGSSTTDFGLWAANAPCKELVVNTYHHRNDRADQRTHVTPGKLWPDYSSGHGLCRTSGYHPRRRHEAPTGYG